MNHTQTEVLFCELLATARCVSQTRIQWRLEMYQDDAPLRLQEENVKKFLRMADLCRKTADKNLLDRIDCIKRHCLAYNAESKKKTTAARVARLGSAYERIVSCGRELCVLALPHLVAGYDIRFGVPAG